MDSVESASATNPGRLAASVEDNTPLRPRASPRSTRCNSVRSSFSFRLVSEQSDSETPSSGEESPIRGRTLARVPAHERLESRAMTRLQTDPSISSLDTVAIRQRFLSRDLTNEPDGIDGSYMEPLPYERFRSSLSEELHKAATSGSSIDLTHFGGHRDTFAVLGLRRTQFRGPKLPESFFQRFLDYIDFEQYLAFRLSCRCWSAGITLARPIVLPSVYRIPAELLEKVYAYLSPIDLNSARHTCRAWMIGSLEERLLTRLLKEGGWWRAAKADMNLHEELKGQRTPESINEEWLLSKRLATECSLRPDWTGNGLSKKLTSTSQEASSKNGIVLTSETDFSELSSGYYAFRIGHSLHGSAVQFTVSACGKFLLVIEGCLIYVYSLRDSTQNSHVHGGHLSPVTTVICPHRVLSVSMDTSAQRFAIAALLEGRVGLVCDIHENSPSLSGTRSTPQNSSNLTREYKTFLYSSASSNQPLFTETLSPHEHPAVRANADIALTRAIGEAGLPEVYGAGNSCTSWLFDDTFVAPEPEPCPSSYTKTDDVLPQTSTRPLGSSTNTGYKSLKTGVRSIYRNLCSSEDPPRSVAICPQRRCVAFGCSAGIELHWIDALTGQDLNRWFPLTTPSDFLYFLPPRPGVDSAKKLRLISSASHPEEKRLGGRLFPRTSTHCDMAWYEGLSDCTTFDSAVRSPGWCDHYYGLPISDGWNILFTDPVEGNLCLGTDTPLGAGVTKLTRRFIFRGPVKNEVSVVPRIYTSGGELRWGVRVVVGYGEAIWLFSLPPDVFFDHQDKASDRQDGRHADAVGEPILVEGINIGQMPGLVDLAIDASGGDLTIWSFAIDGMAYAWQIAGRQQSVARRVVLTDGTVTALQDADGDTYMTNTSKNKAAVHFDGAASLRPTDICTTYLHAPVQPFVHNSSLGLQDRVIDHDRIVDRDGDTNMPDAGGEEDEGYVSGEDELARAGGSFAIHPPPIWGRWSEDDTDWVPDYLALVGEGIEDAGLGVDVLEATRLDVEILCG